MNYQDNTPRLRPSGGAGFTNQEGFGRSLQSSRSAKKEAKRLVEEAQLGALSDEIKIALKEHAFGLSLESIKRVYTRAAGMVDGDPLLEQLYVAAVMDYANSVGGVARRAGEPKLFGW